jgi:hypothetical protein
VTHISKHFEYHNYLRSILKNETADNFIIATEKDFIKSENLNFPYRSYFYVVGLLHESECILRVGFKDFVMKKRSATFVGPGIVRQWIKNDWKARNSTLLFTPEFFQHPFSANFLTHYGIFQTGINHTAQLSFAEYEYANEILHLVKKDNTRTCFQLSGIYKLNLCEAMGKVNF